MPDWALSARIRMALVGVSAMSGSFGYGVAGPPPPPPPPPPAPGTTLANITLLTAGAGTYPWCAGHAFKPGDLPSGAPLAGGVQVTVKSTWPDGSAKIAILAGEITATGTSTTVALGTGQPPNTPWLTLADLVATGITATIDGGAYGSAVWIASDFATPFTIKPGQPTAEQWWAAGPMMSSWIFRKPIGSDPHLTAWLEVRLFRGGYVEVLPWIENGYLLVTGPTEKPGTYSFTLGGTSRFSATLPVHHHTRAPLLSGAATSYWLGTDKTVTPKHSNTYLYSTGLVQRYMTAVERNFGNITGGRGVSMQFTPYETFGPTVTIHSTNMGQGGGHASIGVQPAWEAIALVDNSATGYTQLLRECFRMGQWQIHYRDESTNRPVKFTDRAGVQLRVGEADALVNVYERQDAGLTQTPAIVGTNNAGSTGKFTNSHQPAAPLLAYVMSGRFWFMEECQHIAGVNFLQQGLSRAGTALHKIEPSITPFRLQMRGAAWSMRNLMIAECATPDDDPLRPSYTASVDHNIDYYHGKYIAPYGSAGMNPLGVVQCVGVGTYDGNQAWQYDFFTGAWGRAIAFRNGSSVAQRKKAREFFDWISRSVVGRLGGTGATEFLYRFATTASNRYPGKYNSRLFAGSTPGSFTVDGSGNVVSDYNDGTAPNYTSGTGPWLADWGAFYEKRIVTDEGYTGGKVDGALMGPDALETDGWWAMLREAISTCAALSAPGAVTALNRLRANSVWADNIVSGSIYADAYPVNAVDYTTLPLEDHNTYVPAAGARANVNKNSATSVDWDVTAARTNVWYRGYGGANAWASMVSSYSGSYYLPNYGPKGAFGTTGGGHGGQISKAVYCFDFDTLTHKQHGATRNIPATAAWLGYADGATFATYNSALDQRSLDWLDYAHNGSYIDIENHSYNQNGYIPPALGGGRLGSILWPEAHFDESASNNDPRPGSSGDNALWAPRMMDLDTGRISRATAAPLGGWPGFSSTVCVPDTIRNRLWYFIQSASTSRYHQLGVEPLTMTIQTLQTQTGATSALPVTQCAYLFVPAADAIICLSPSNQSSAQANGAMALTVLTMGTGLPVHRLDANLPAPYPMLHGGWNVGVAFVPASRVGGVGKFYIYEGWGDTFCTTLTPSSLDFATCTWAWGKESFSGPAPVNKNVLPQIMGNAGTEAPYGKFMWVPGLDALSWYDGPDTTGVCADGVTRDGIVQLWRPPGTPI